MKAAWKMITGAARDSGRALTVSPDGGLVASSGADQTIRLWRASDGQQVRVIPSINCHTLKFSADGKLLLTANLGPINVWRVSTGQLICSYPSANALPLAVAPNGKYFAYGQFDGSVLLAHMPLWIEDITQSKGEVTLHWHGGSGLYQVQARAVLGVGDWQNLGPVTTNTNDVLQVYADSGGHPHGRFQAWAAEPLLDVSDHLLRQSGTLCNGVLGETATFALLPKKAHHFCAQ